jgi:hypothetical protein
MAAMVKPTNQPVAIKERAIFRVMYLWARHEKKKNHKKNVFFIQKIQNQSTEES